jgi:Family of unknown function (DUF6600)/FecR protein
MTNRLSFRQLILGIGTLAIIAGSAWAQVYSHARIVRLSFEEGTVTLVRPDAPSGVEASVNMPIEEGFKLDTAEDSFAEVEFENTSTARVGQLSELDFNQLALDSNGGKLNRMELRQGYATFNLIPEDGDVYEVKAGAATATLAGDKLTRYRVDLEGTNLRVEVFKGAVDVSSLYGDEHLTKNAVLEIRPGDDQPVTLSRGITKDPWDDWVEEREDQAQVARRKSPPGLYTNDVTSLLYGWNDLYYYGNWAYVPGYGYGWIPSVGSGWAPYSYGQWTWYSGFGITWISYEPWGWVPFHYGGWVYQPSFGWCWIPGGFNAWSPSLVSWYQGPGWVGWTPRPPYTRPGGRPTPAFSNCSSASTCATVMSVDSFRAGSPVSGHRMTGVSVTGAFAVDQPEVQPELAGGAPLTSRTAGRSPLSPAVARPENQVGASGGATVPGNRTRPETGTAGVRAPSSGRQGTGFKSAEAPGVVYDPAERSYVNGAQTAPRPAGVETPSAAGPAATAAPAVHTEAPSPGSRPESPREPSRLRPAAAGEHHASPRTGIESSPAAPPTGVFEKTLNSWGVGRTTPPASSGSSGNWSAPSSTNSGRMGGNGGGAESGGFKASSPRAGGGGGGGARSAPSSGRATPHR